MRQLEMKYAGGGIVRHLGLQNYKGPVPALAELVSNSWDADATEVRVSIPFDRQIRPSDAISVKDNGCGMTWTDCDAKYLVIGRNRRAAERRDRSDGGRPLTAHKGLGKLAGFGIATVVEVKTIKKGKLTHFVMEFLVIDKLDQGEPYRPKVVADEEDTELGDGTEIILRDLSYQRVIPKDQFLRSMISRFAILSDKFKVYVNGELLKKERLPFQFRFPERVENDVTKIDHDGWGYTDLPPEIKWWVGFTEKPIQLEGVKGISVLTRGKLCQEPWDFDLAGGAWGQHGLRYMTGEIVADFLDEGLEKDNDLVLTNRSGVAWDHPKATPLYEWARKKIKTLLSEWAERRGKKVVEDVQKEHPQLVKMIEQFQPRERKELNAAMRKLAEVPDIEPEKLASIFEYVVDGYRDKAFVNMLEEIKEMPPEDQVKTLEILKEFDVLEAVRVHGIVSSHVRVIRTFKELIEAGVPEKPDMHEQIKKYPWLLGIRYEPMDYEPSLQSVLEKRFGIKAEGTGKKKKPDFVCMRSGSHVLVIELKRPGEKVGHSELQQVAGYVDYLRHWVTMSTAPKELAGVKIVREGIEGYLVAYDFQDDPTVQAEIKRLEDDRIFVCRWKDVSDRVEAEYKEFLQIIKKRAPRDDPRIIELERKGIV